MSNNLLQRANLKIKLEDKTEITTINSMILNLTKETKQNKTMYWNAYFKMISD